MFERKIYLIYGIDRSIENLLSRPTWIAILTRIDMYLILRVLLV